MVDPDWTYPDTHSYSRDRLGSGFNASQWDAWFATYTAYIAHWAAIAQQQGADALCVGAELATAETQAEQWPAVFAAARTAFTNGPVYYSSELGSAFVITWWHLSDYVAVDVYPNLAVPDPNHPLNNTVEQLVAAWQPTVSQLQSLASRNNRTLLVAETGICGIDYPGIYAQPWYYKCVPPAVVTVALDVQTRYYASFFQALYAQPWVAGVMFWKWLSWPADNTPGSTWNGNFPPHNHPAAAIMAAAFAVA
jgi:hypothetical protein